MVKWYINTVYDGQEKISECGYFLCNSFHNSIRKTNGIYFSFADLDYCVIKDSLIVGSLGKTKDILRVLKWIIDNKFDCSQKAIDKFLKKTLDYTEKHQ